MTGQTVKKTIPFSPTESAGPDSSLSTLIGLERAARNAGSTERLAFLAANETHRLIDYYQCLLWRMSPAGKVKLQAISGVSEIDYHSAAGQALQRLVRAVHDSRSTDAMDAITQEDLPPRFRKDWEEWLPAHGLWCPFSPPEGEVRAGLMITRDSEFADEEIELLTPLVEAYAHAWNALEAKGGRTGAGLVRGLRSRAFRVLSLAAITGLMALPVRESALAPAEIVADQALMVAAPVKGVIKEFNVRPNEQVQGGHPLFSMDDTEFKSRYEIAAKGLEVARAEYLRSAQKSFSDARSKSEMELLRVRVEQKKLELDYARTLLNKTVVRAERSGIAVFSDANDWIGKPVEIGERIMMLADPKRAEIQIWLAVEDGINLEPGSDVHMFLNTDPTSPLKGRIRQTSYHPGKTAEGTLAFRLKAELDASQELPRIGLKGTAKVYGSRVSIFYYILRRPLSALRQTLGI